jgi:CRISPR/Cas system-associated exonuclease Cas4 (RecB family)
MSASFLLPATHHLIEEVAARLIFDGADYSSNLVVFPGKRPAFFLRKIIAEKRKQSFIPPRIVSIEELIEELSKHLLTKQPQTLTPLDAVAILFEIHRASPVRFGGDHYLSLDTFLPLGIKLFGELEELQLANCSFEQARETLSGISYGNVHIISAVYEKFYTALEQKNLVTRAMKYRRVANSFSPTALSEFQHIVVAGFFSSTQTEIQLLQKFSQLNHVTFLFQEGTGIHRFLSRLEIPTATIAEEERPPAIFFYRSPDSHGQVFACNEQLNECLQMHSALDEETVIVLPSSDTLFPLLHHSLSSLPNTEYNISVGYGITRSPVFSFYNALLELLATKNENTCSASQYIAFILHPYVKNILFHQRADVTRMVFHSIEKYFAASKAHALFSLEELEEHLPSLITDTEEYAASELQSHLREIHRRVIRPLLAYETIGDFANNSIEVLRYIEENSTAKRHPYFYPFMEKIVEALDALAHSSIAPQKFSSARSYAQFLRAYLQTIEVHFSGTPFKGLQVLGFLETRTIKFRRVFVLDANEHILPTSSSGTESFIPQKAREKLGMEMLSEKERLAAYYFDVLLNGAEEAHIFFTENETQERSRLVETLLWEKQRRDGIYSDEQYVKNISYQLSLKNSVPETVAKTVPIVDVLKHFSFSATSLDTYLECGLKFYYRYVLGLSETKRFTDEIEMSDVGNIVHKVLNDFFKPFTEQTLQENQLNRETLANILFETLRTSTGSVEFAHIASLQTQIEKQLQRFLEHYQFPLLRSQAIVLKQSEQQYAVQYQQYRFSARIDRIEQRGEQWYVLDYKTGGDETRYRIRFDKLIPDDATTWRNAIGSLQLPLYAFIISRAHNIPIEKILPVYIFLGAKNIDEHIEVPLFEHAEQRIEQYAMLQKIIFKLLDEIMDGTKDFKPTENLEQHCPRCTFQNLCGTQWMERWEE